MLLLCTGAVVMKYVVAEDSWSCCRPQHLWLEHLIAVYFLPCTSSLFTTFKPYTMVLAASHIWCWYSVGLQSSKGRFNGLLGWRSYNWTRLKKKAERISTEGAHLRYFLFELLLSGKQFETIKTRTNRLLSQSCARHTILHDATLTATLIFAHLHI